MQFKLFTLVVALATQATASILERQINQQCCIPPGLQCILNPNPPFPPYLNICCPPFLCMFDPTDPQSPIGMIGDPLLTYRRFGGGLIWLGRKIIGLHWADDCRWRGAGHRVIGTSRQ
ncbi:hypothetical protein DFH08DRAFT_799620 [Mycena albidolilacea]|uniref:Uncharacterized protein n=1 Tax=Mycena albidolilacea TaxID=1033008 RepID=A0AAD7ALR1_9AGAR|nr:hypothetical protein DFH08DRAFT_799620 [Mycena albidolilacea]